MPRLSSTARAFGRRSFPPEASLALLLRGYRYAPDRRAAAVAVPIRLFGRRAVLLGGADGARLFYDAGRLRRRGALPPPVKNVLFGRGALHALDGEAHLHRKAMFLSLLTPAAARDIASGVRRRWETVVDEAAGKQLALFDTAVRVLGDAVCDWAGIPADRVDAGLAGSLAAIVDGFGGIGPRFVRAGLARRRANVWATELIEAVRAGVVQPPTGSALQAVATHRDRDGARLPALVAGVELLNLLRPTVAIAYFVAFTGLALHDQPEWKARLRDGDDATLEAFANEVRRFYPFAPLLGARVRQEFQWRELRFAAGRRVLLDLYGTDHDPACWRDPDSFDPHRFLGVEPDTYTLIPQGGGEPTGHRCPGERATIEVLKTTAHLLSCLDYDVPPQRLAYRPGRMPTRPASGFVVSGIRRR